MANEYNPKERLAEKLALDEFAQMHEHIRKREEAMNHLLTMTVTGGTTFLGAIAAFVFQLGIATPEKLSIPICYLLLFPIPFVLFALSTLSSHRDDIFKMGYYIKVFIEEPVGGAMWHRRLESLREKISGESQDPTAWALWCLFLVSSGLFCISVIFLKEGAFHHCSTVIVLIGAMVGLHRRFLRNRGDIEKSWQEIKSAELRC